MKKFEHETFAEVAIIGGTPEERLLTATHLSRRGISVYTETRQSKRASMLTRALREVRCGLGDIYDLDDAEEREYLARPNAFREGQQ